MHAYTLHYLHHQVLGAHECEGEAAPAGVHAALLSPVHIKHGLLQLKPGSQEVSSDLILIGEYEVVEPWGVRTDIYVLI